MGIDWETILGASGADLQDAYDDYVEKAMELTERYKIEEDYSASAHEAPYPTAESSDRVDKDESIEESGS